MDKSMFQFNDEESTELQQIVFTQAKQYIKEATKKMQEETFDKVSSDLEEWIWERFENVRSRYFDSIVNYLLGNDIMYVTSEDKIKIDKYLSDIGFTPKSLRRKIYYENKEVVEAAITDQIIYERLKSCVGITTYFKCWGFKDVGANYPQSEIIRKMIMYLLRDKDSFENYLSGQISDKINKKYKDLEYIKKKIAEAQNALAEFDSSD